MLQTLRSRVRKFLQRIDIRTKFSTTANTSGSYEYNLIKTSDLFDETWYNNAYADVHAARLDSVDHYIRHGAAEGRNPGPAFDTVWYVSENPDIQARGLNPLAHYIEHRTIPLSTAVPLSAGQKYESFDRALKAGAIDGRPFFHCFPDVSFGSKLVNQHDGSSRMPLPPVELSARIGSPTLDGFLDIGKEAKTTITRCLPVEFSFKAARCLDFGCGIGRVIRHFETEAEHSEFWGCDIDGTSIQWCNEHLNPPFRFFQLSNSPIIPFESSSFDLVYAVGVFSQVFVDWQLLAMEIRRILKPGGLCFMSFNGQTSFEEMFGKSYDKILEHTGMFVNSPYKAWNKGGPNVALSPEWIKTHWGAIFDIDYIAMEGLMDYQSFCMLRKPALGQPRSAADIPIMHLGTSQPFNPDATGKLAARFDASKPFLSSYGIEVAETTREGGWIVFKDDRVLRLDVFIDDELMSVDGEFQDFGETYRDWNACKTSFSFPIDRSLLSAGSKTLRVSLFSQNGKHHEMSMPLTIL